MEKTNNLIKVIDNEMAPRFGHTITLGKIYIMKFKNLKQFCSVVRLVLKDVFL